MSSLAEDRMRTPFDSFWELAEAGPVGIESRQGAHTLRITLIALAIVPLTLLMKRSVVEGDVHIGE